MYNIAMKKIISKTNLILIIISLLLTIITSFVYIFVDGFYSTYNLLYLIAFFVLTLAPAIIEVIWKKRLANYVTISYFCFILLSILLGTIYDFYIYIHFYDTLLHFMSGVLIALFGLYFLNSSKHELSKPISIIIVVCFSIACAALWEIWEFSTDSLLHLNSQKYMDPDGIEYIGQIALRDTMKDIIAGTLGAISVGILMIFTKKKKSITEEL